MKLAWGIPEDNQKKNPRIEETGKWQAFNSTDGKGTWWWHAWTEEWFLETEPGIGHNSTTKITNHTGVTRMDAVSVPHWNPG